MMVMVKAGSKSHGRVQGRRGKRVVSKGDDPKAGGEEEISGLPCFSTPLFATIPTLSSSPPYPSMCSSLVSSLSLLFFFSFLESDRHHHQPFFSRELRLSAHPLLLLLL